MSVLRNKTNRLLAKFKCGDKAAFKELFDMLFKRLVVIAGCNLNDKTQAEDVVSSSFLQICKNIDAFDEDKDGYNWIVKIVKNKALDVNRTSHPSESLDENAACKDAFDAVNNKADIYIALRKLKESERRLIYKRFFEQLTYSEIAAEEGVSPQSIHKRIDEILKKLKVIMENG